MSHLHATSDTCMLQAGTYAACCTVCTDTMWHSSPMSAQDMLTRLSNTHIQCNMSQSHHHTDIFYSFYSFSWLFLWYLIVFLCSEIILIKSCISPRKCMWPVWPTVKVTAWSDWRWATRSDAGDGVPTTGSVVARWTQLTGYDLKWSMGKDLCLSILKKLFIKGVVRKSCFLCKVYTQFRGACNRKQTSYKFCLKRPKCLPIVKIGNKNGIDLN